MRNVPAAGLTESLSLVERWAEATRASCTPGTIGTRRASLRGLARRLGDRSLTEASEDDVRAWLATVGPQTRWNYTAAVRSFCSWAIDQGAMAEHLIPLRGAAELRTPSGRAMTRYLAERRAAGVICQRTEQKFRGVLLDFLGHCPDDPATITRRHVVAWLKTNQQLAASTRRVYHSAASGFTAWLQRRGILRRDPFAELPIPKVPRPAHRALDAAQVAALLAACETRREHLLLMLALHTGLRRAELAALEVGDVSLSARTVVVRHGKGGHSRLLPLSDEAAAVVAGYLSAEGLRAGPLLRSESHAERGIGPQTVWSLFNRVAVRSGVKVRPGDGVATHAARHTLATEAHRATGDVLVVQALLGHAALSTTARYVAGLDVERLRAGVEGRRYLAQPGSETAQ